MLSIFLNLTPFKISLFSNFKLNFRNKYNNLFISKIKILELE